MNKLDLTYLENISKGDVAFIKEMLGMVLTNTLPEVENLVKHVKANSLSEVAATAHKIKAPIQMVGNTYVTDLIVDLERMSKQREDIGLCEKKIGELAIALKDLEKEMHAYMKA